MEERSIVKTFFYELNEVITMLGCLIKKTHNDISFACFDFNIHNDVLLVMLHILL